MYIEWSHVNSPLITMLYSNWLRSAKQASFPKVFLAYETHKPVTCIHVWHSHIQVQCSSEIQSLVQLLQQLLWPLCVAGEESTEEHPAEVCPSASAGAIAAWCPTQHSEACGGTVQQGPATWCEGPEAVCDQWRTEKDSGNQGRTRNSPSWAYQWHKQLLSWRNCQVSHGFMQYSA